MRWSAQAEVIISFNPSNVCCLRPSQTTSAPFRVSSLRGVLNPNSDSPTESYEPSNFPHILWGWRVGDLLYFVVFRFVISRCAFLVHNNYFRPTDLCLET